MYLKAWLKGFNVGNFVYYILYCDPGHSESVVLVIMVGSESYIHPIDSRWCFVGELENNKVNDKWTF